MGPGWDCAVCHCLHQTPTPNTDQHHAADDVHDLDNDDEKSDTDQSCGVCHNLHPTNVRSSAKQSFGWKKRSDFCIPFNLNLRLLSVKYSLSKISVLEQIYHSRWIMQIFSICPLQRWLLLMIMRLSWSRIVFISYNDYHHHHHISIIL